MHVWTWCRTLSAQGPEVPSNPNHAVILWFCIQNISELYSRQEITQNVQPIELQNFNKGLHFVLCNIVHAVTETIDSNMAKSETSIMTH